jgi:hypothetical protein
MCRRDARNWLGSGVTLVVATALRRYGQDLQTEPIALDRANALSAELRPAGYGFVT